MASSAAMAILLRWLSAGSQPKNAGQPAIRGLAPLWHVSRPHMLQQLQQQLKSNNSLAVLNNLSHLRLCLGQLAHPALLCQMLVVSWLMTSTVQLASSSARTRVDSAE